MMILNIMGIVVRMRAETAEVGTFLFVCLGVVVVVQFLHVF